MFKIILFDISVKIIFNNSKREKNYFCNKTGQIEL